MAKAVWGVKRTCAECGARFYDLKRTPIICPKCETEFVIAPPPKPKRLRPFAAAKPAAKTTDNLIDDEDKPGSDTSSDSADDGDDAAPNTDAGNDDPKDSRHRPPAGE